MSDAAVVINPKSADWVSGFAFDDVLPPGKILDFVTKRHPFHGSFTSLTTLENKAAAHRIRVYIIVMRAALYYHRFLHIPSLDHFIADDVAQRDNVNGGGDIVRHLIRRLCLARRAYIPPPQDPSSTIQHRATDAELVLMKLVDTMLREHDGDGLRLRQKEGPVPLPGNGDRENEELQAYRWTFNHWVTTSHRAAKFTLKGDGPATPYLLRPPPIAPRSMLALREEDRRRHDTQQQQQQQGANLSTLTPRPIDDGAMNRADPTYSMVRQGLCDVAGWTAQLADGADGRSCPRMREAAWVLARMAEEFGPEFRWPGLRNMAMACWEKAQEDEAGAGAAVAEKTGGIKKETDE